MQVITNNPLVRDHDLSCDMKYIEGSLLDVLEEVKRIVIEEKEVIHTHPLSSSLKPNETVYKTVVLSTKPQAYIDLDSLDLIEQAISVHEKFQHNFQTPQWPQNILEDFALIDYDLIMSTLPRLLYAN